MTAYLRLVVDTAQGNAAQLPVQRTGYAHGDGGLADTGRAHQADDLPGHIGRKLLDRKSFKDAFLDLFQAKVVLVQNSLSGLDIQTLLGLFAPGQLQRRVQIVADDGGLGGAIGLLCQTLDFLHKFFFYFVGELQRLDLLAVFLDLRLVVALTQLRADDLHLLPQEIVPLALVNALLGLVLDAVFQPQHLQLLGHELVGHLQAVDGMQILQHAHFLRIAEGRRLGQKVCDQARIVSGENFQHHVLHRALGQVGKLVKQLRGLPFQRLDLRRTGRVFQLRHRLGPGAEVGRFFHDLRDPGAVLAIDQNTDRISGHLQNLPYMGNSAHGVQILQLRVIL